MQYYDWETNVCHRFDWLEDNTFSQVESDTEIPEDVDPSREAKYYPEFEPQRLEQVRIIYLTSDACHYSVTAYRQQIGPFWCCIASKDVLFVCLGGLYSRDKLSV